MPELASPPCPAPTTIGWRGGLLVAAVALALMLATEPRLAITWDEGYTLGRVARVRAWFTLLAHPGRIESWRDPPEFDLVQPDRADAVAVPRPIVTCRADLLRPAAIAWFWPFAREEPHGHPPFYGWVALLGDLLTPGRAPLARARLGPMIVFSLTAGAIFVSLARRQGARSGGAAAGAWVLHPHLFALGHYAHYDALLSGLWMGALLAFAAAVEGRRRRGAVVLFGLLAGLAAATKFTGWLLPLPLLAWSVWRRDRRALVVLVWGGLVAAATLYVVTPPFWFDPVGGVQRFLESNLTRARTIPLPVQFLGEVIKTPIRSLPWYNTLLWTVLATPVGLLVLGVWGAAFALRHSLTRGERTSDPLPGLVLSSWVFLLVLRALPHTPGHDGVRQFLPAFGCLAVLAGLGAARAVACLGRRGRALVVLGLAEAAVSVGLMMPVPLSYFSPLAGGLPGAARLGMEPTFYWDALDPDTFAWLNQHTAPDRKVEFSSYPLSLRYLRQIGWLTAEMRREIDRPVAWYVLQNRPGLFRPIDRELLARGRPARVVRKWGVPLVLIYADSERRRLESPRKDGLKIPVVAIP